MIVVTILLIFLPYQGDNGSSSSKYSFKIDKNKVKWGGKDACFPNMEKASVQVCQTQTDWFNKNIKTKQNRSPY